MVEEVDQAMSDREKVLVEALAQIASGLGRGGVVGTPSYNGARPLRLRATQALLDTGYEYAEYPLVARSGWYLKDGMMEARLMKKILHEDG